MWRYSSWHYASGLARLGGVDRPGHWQRTICSVASRNLCTRVSVTYRRIKANGRLPLHMFPLVAFAAADEIRKTNWMLALPPSPKPTSTNRYVRRQPNLVRASPKTKSSRSDWQRRPNIPSSNPMVVLLVGQVNVPLSTTNFLGWW